MDRSPLEVAVVSADRVVWEGKAVNIIARTVEGDIGILPGHEPLLAALVPCVVEIVTADGRSEKLVIDGGFISVANGRVSVLSQYTSRGEEISLETARKELAAMELETADGSANLEQLHRKRILQAQIRAGESSQKTGSI